MGLLSQKGGCLPPADFDVIPRGCFSTEKEGEGRA